MDIEQLKLILDTVGAAGEGAQTVALTWFGVYFMTEIAGYATWILTVFLAISTAKWFANKAIKEEQLERDLRKAFEQLTSVETRLRRIEIPGQ